MAAGGGISGFHGIGHSSQNADTRIQARTQVRKGKFTYLDKLVYVNGVTPHTITLMRRISKTTLTAAAAAAQAVIAIAADPGDADTGVLAANDVLCILKPDGTFHLAVVSSVAGLNITLTANVPTGGFASGATVLFYGAAADLAHVNQVYRALASVTTTLTANQGALCRSTAPNEPIVIDVNNITNAGHLEYASGFFSEAA